MKPTWVVARRTERRTSAIPAALYAAVVLFAPLSHAAFEVVHSTASVESAHSDACPTLHGAAACYLLATLQLAEPSAATPVGAAGKQEGTRLVPVPSAPRPLTAAVPPPARAPPQR